MLYAYRYYIQTRLAMIGVDVDVTRAATNLQRELQDDTGQRRGARVGVAQVRGTGLKCWAV